MTIVLQVEMLWDDKNAKQTALKVRLLANFGSRLSLWRLINHPTSSGSVIQLHAGLNISNVDIEMNPITAD